MRLIPSSSPPPSPAPAASNTVLARSTRLKSGNRLAAALFIRPSAMRRVTCRAPAGSVRHILRLQLGRRLPRSFRVPLVVHLSGAPDPLCLQAQVVTALHHRATLITSCLYALCLRLPLCILRYSSYGCPYKCTGWQHTFLFLYFLSVVGTSSCNACAHASSATPHPLQLTLGAGFYIT